MFQPFTFNSIPLSALRKIVALDGDIAKPSLGLSGSDKQKVIDEVSVVFNIAASTRMDLSLKDALYLNTISTQYLLDLCTEMKSLVSVVHLSTAFCNTDIDFAEEKVYQTKLDPHKLIRMVEWMDDKNLDKIQESLMRPHPNSYTFSKRLAEIIVMDMGKKLPLSIGRPSIVTPTMCEPIPGWVDSINGPIGLFVAAGKGVLRSIPGNKKLSPQLIPVDTAVNALIVMAHIRTVEKFDNTPVYNLTQGELALQTWDGLIKKFRRLALEHPFTKKLWYPSGDMISTLWIHYFNIVVFHMIPAYFIDFLLFMFLQEPFLMKVLTRLNNGMEMLKYFALRKFIFTNENFANLSNRLHPDDRKDFTVLKEESEYNIDQYVYDCFNGAREYCFQEPINDTFLRRIEITVLYLLDKIFKYVYYYIAIWLVLYVFGRTHLLSFNFWVGDK